MSYSKGAPDNFVPELRRVDSPPPVSGSLAWLVAVLALVTLGLCVGWLLIVMW